MAIGDQLALHADAVCGTIDVVDWENYGQHMREHFASDGTKARLWMDAYSANIENDTLPQVLRCLPSAQQKGWSACRLRRISEPLAVRLKQCNQSRYVLPPFASLVGSGKGWHELTSVVDTNAMSLKRKSHLCDLLT